MRTSFNFANKKIEIDNRWPYFPLMRVNLQIEFPKSASIHLFVTARIRRMGEGTVFSLFVSSHLDGGSPRSQIFGRGGIPGPRFSGGVPSLRFSGGVPGLRFLGGYPVSVFQGGPRSQIFGRGGTWSQ